MATGVVLSPAERERQQQERAARLQAAEAERIREQDAAAQRCQGMWDSFSPAVSSPYLEKKGVEVFGLKEDQGNLIVPLRNIHGELRGFQAIAPDGRKGLATGIGKKGNFHLIGADGKDLSQGEIVLCEGYATGASLHMATGKAVAVDGKKAVFEAKGRTLREQGWKVVMAADASLADAEEAEPDNAVPDLKAGCQATAVQGAVKMKKTKPAPRFSEASLIREMEKRGIGRPATYAAIMENIAARAYVKEEKAFLVPTPRGEKLVDALAGAFGFLDLDFTSHMEERLDDVANGNVSYVQCVGAFHAQLMEELGRFVQAHAVPCPACGDREQFRHVYSREKGWNFWGCKACGAIFADDNGRPGLRQEKGAAELTDFLCEKCGKPLHHLQGTKKDGSGQYDFFACSDKACGAKYDNVDGRPVIRKAPALSEHTCKKCGKPLVPRPTKNGGVWFGCSGFPMCKARYWAKDDGSPDYDNPPKH